MSLSRTVLVVAAAVLLASVAAAATFLAVPKEAEATLPGQNGKIAYVRDNVSEETIFMIKPNGEGKTRVTKGWDPSFSPDGEQIAYARWNLISTNNGSYDMEIYTINLRTGGRVQLTNNNTYDRYPAYSPDGKKIAYVGDDGHDPEIYTMNPDGGGKSKVPHGGFAADFQISWGSRP